MSTAGPDPETEIDHIPAAQLSLDRVKPTMGLSQPILNLPKPLALTHHL